MAHDGGDDGERTLLEGEGAYESLTAVIHDDPGITATYGGVIFAGGLPPTPDPVEPRAEWTDRLTIASAVSVAWRSMPGARLPRLEQLGA